MSQTNQRTAWIAGIFLVLAAIFGFAYFTWPTPQLGSDEQVRSEVDALFTAITARDDKLLEQCKARIDVLKSESKVTPAVAGHLQVIIDQAKNGGWEPAAKRLYTFIQGQRL